MKNNFLCAVLIVAHPLTSIAIDEKNEIIEMEKMEVFGVSPLSEEGLEKYKIPTNVQAVTSDQLQNSQSLSLADYMNRYLGNVFVNEVQNNPFQPDVSYRGFTASPLLGLPQGMSVYVNGVRFNEPFGDTVNWDLIPKGAIDKTTLHPGSNPVYGLNTLGGAISIRTKTGFSAPGHQLEISGGSWDRHSQELSSGWNNGTVGYFLDINNFSEQGWRDFSRSSVKQGLGTLSWHTDRSSLDLTVAATDNKLKGNGALPIQLFEQAHKAVFTHPDQTVNRLFFTELAGAFDITDDIKLTGNAYYRQNRSRTFNGDDSDFEECEEEGNEGFICEEEDDGEEVAVDIDGNLIEGAESLEGATQNTSQTHQRSHGVSLQTAFSQDIFGFGNHLVVGGNYDSSEINFSSDSELASLTSTRGTVGGGVLLEDARVRLNSETYSFGLFISDTFSLSEDLAITLAGRYNSSNVRMNDDFGDALNGRHSFSRFNPSYGLTYRITDYLTFYGNYSESSRAPTAMELSCADPEDPCKLPNSFVADPPLNQVVVETWEGGFRGDFDTFSDRNFTRWNLGFFHSLNKDDIIFRRDGGSISQGFFSNVGKTRRYGIEAGIKSDFDHLLGNFDRWHFSANYSYLNARFLDGFIIQDPLENSEAAQVSRGNRIPGIPEHIFKFSVSTDLWDSFTLGVDGLYSGDKFFRGDEANLTGKLGGFWVFNLRAEYRINEHFALFGKLDNVFDRRYKTFGVYGEADEVLGNQFDDGRFVSPGAPRAGWIGIRLNI
ncbi:MAG: TonB-dependent receptor [Methylococcaceae bacterium]